MKHMNSKLSASKTVITAAILLVAMFTMLAVGCAGGEGAAPPPVDEGPMAGAYNNSREVEEDDLAVYFEAMGDEADYYVPRLVATQVVAGINYRFACVDAGNAEEPDAPMVYVFIYQPLDGPAEFVKVSVNEDGSDG